MWWRLRGMGGRGREGCVRLGDGSDLVGAGCEVSWEGAGSNLEAVLAAICMITGEVCFLLFSLYLRPLLL